MIEKSIILEDIPLVDFLGVRNKNINELVATFPKNKITSRGNEITVQGNEDEIAQIMHVLNALIEHFHQFGHITEKHVKHYYKMRKEPKEVPEKEPDELLLHGNQGLPIKVRTKNQQALVKAVENNDLVFALGPAGTGKTYISVALAIRALKKKQIQRIVITRPVVEAGENLGFLPGDLKAKIDPYLRPIYDVLRNIISVEKMDYYMEREIIEIAPLAYMRGRTLQHAFILLDEAQNTTPMQMKMVLTRMGPTSKMMVTGDTSQIDLHTHQQSGLKDAVQKLQDIKNIAFVRLTEHDVVRHQLVKDIIQAYQKNSTHHKQ